jgi:hypothetical protein
MERKLTKQEVEAQLQAKTDTIHRRIDALEHEVATTGDDLRAAVLTNPWVILGGALAAGLFVGYWLIGRKQRKLSLKSGRAQKALVDTYIDTVAAHARHAVHAGKEAGAAVREALRDRVPLIVYAPEDETAKEMGFIRGTLDTAFKAALGLAVKSAFDRLYHEVDWLAHHVNAQETPVNGSQVSMGEASDV